MIFGERRNMRLQDFFLWRSQAANNLPVIANEDDMVGENIIELPEAPQKSHLESEFHRLAIQPPSDRMRLSLLTQAIQGRPINRNNLTRRQSINSMNGPELTSDGDLTSPDCSSTLSPPYPSLGNCNFNSKNSDQPKENDEKRPNTPSGRDMSSEEYNQTTRTSSNLFSHQKRSIAFACPARPAVASTSQPRSDPRIHSPLSNPIEPTHVDLAIDSSEPPRRKTTLKFACPGPPPKPTQVVNMPPLKTTSEFSSRPRLASPMSPFQTTPGSIKENLERFSSTLESGQSQSCDSMDDENYLENFEATRFHEFASENMQEADWLRRDVGLFSSKLTINDTLKRENEIRRLASEAEAEALEDEEDENICDEDSDGKHDEDDVDDDEDDDYDEVDNEDEKNDVTRYFGGFYSGDDGNERDNEAGFADSDESDKEEEFSFWNSGHRSSTKNVAISSSLATSNSSNFSSNFRSRVSTRRKNHAQKIPRTATPDLPDSTDFVCGTLDEDRPLEEAYLSCMEARKLARHKLTPQDIDPSFPTSDSEDEIDHHSEASKKISNGNQGQFNDVKFEVLVERTGRTSSPQSQVSPARYSPRKLYSPPPARRLRSPSPAKQRLRSPPPRKLFGNSPKRKQSMNHARQLPIHKKTASNNRSDLLDAFAAGPKATFTKSLPRTPNIFGNEYGGFRLSEKSCDIMRGDHFRRAIDIVKGLEQKRQRRKEKFYSKQAHRKSRGYPDHKTQPGHGAERMRELGLLMASKVAAQNHYILSA